MMPPEVPHLVQTHDLQTRRVITSLVNQTTLRDCVRLTTSPSQFTMTAIISNPFDVADPSEPRDAWGFIGGGTHGLWLLLVSLVEPGFEVSLASILAHLDASNRAGVGRALSLIGADL